jgi:membrane protein required for colicin V production
MPVIDIIIVIAIIVSVIIGLLRGFVKEAIAIAALLFAIWAAAGWLDSEEMQVWFGRIFLFAVIVSLGALVSWGLSKLVRVSLLAGMDRFLGSVFGLARAVLLVGLAVLAGQYTGFDNDEWWLDSTLIPHFEVVASSHFEVVASWINVMAPQGYDLLTPDEPAEVLPVRMPDALSFSGD